MTAVVRETSHVVEIFDMTLQSAEIPQAIRGLRWERQVPLPVSVEPWLPGGLVRAFCSVRQGRTGSKSGWCQSEVDYTSQKDFLTLNAPAKIDK